MNEELIEVIELIKQNNPLQTKSVQEYLSMLRVSCSEVPHKIILECCRKYKAKRLYDKPVVYLQAVILNTWRDLQKEKKKQQDKQGTLPQTPGLT